MKTVNVSEAKASLSQHPDSVASEEEVIIARSGRPIAKLIPCEIKQKSRKPGCWKGKVKIARDFDVTQEFMIRAFQN